MSCDQCRGRDYLCQGCRMDALEARHGVPSDYIDYDESEGDDESERDGDGGSDIVEVYRGP